MPTRSVLYSRDLPGGGFVAIDTQPAAGDAASQQARLWVERRADSGRRLGHTPPVIAQAVALDLAHAVAELRAIAADNVALAQAMRRWARQRAASRAPADPS